MKRLIYIITFFLVAKLCDAQTIITVAGNGTIGSNGDGGFATLAELNYPAGITLDGLGNLYIADRINHLIRKVNSSGIITTVAGNDTAGYNGDTGLATLAKLNYPSDVAVDAAGNIYISDYGNNRIRKVNTSGFISTIAGTGALGYSGDGGLATAAQIDIPEGVAIDALGNIYIADCGNQRIRKVNTFGIISTVAGNGSIGFSGDGGLAIAAQFAYPQGVSVDNIGNIYISDRLNNRIRKVDTSGIISTVAGIGTQGFSGDGGSAIGAELNYPYSTAIDTAGNLYIADHYNDRIRVVNSSGIITTIVGDGTQGFSGDGGPANVAQLNTPDGVACDINGNVYISDTYNKRIRKVTITTSIKELKNDYSIVISPNPNNGSFKFQIPYEINNGEIILINSLGQKIIEQRITNGENNIISNELTKGLYQYNLLQNNLLLYAGKIIIE